MSKEMRLEQKHMRPTLYKSAFNKKLYHSPHIPYITTKNAPPSAINLTKVVNDHKDYIFQNKQLAGGEAARAKIPPIITPPIVSEEYWKINDFMVPTGINSATNVDLTRSGYLEQGCYNGTEIIEPFTTKETQNTKISIATDPQTSESVVMEPTKPQTSQIGTLIEDIEAAPKNTNGSQDLINPVNDHKFEGHVPNGFINTTNLQKQSREPQIDCENCCNTHGANSCAPECKKNTSNCW